MDHKLILVIVSLVAMTLFFVPSFTVNADDDHKQQKWYNKILDNDANDSDHHQRKRERKRDGSHSGSSIKAVNNTVYQENCGACHFSYQPDLMPSASWTALIKHIDDHFGESVELDNDSAKAIVDYLNANSAEKSRTKIGKKLLKASEIVSPSGSQKYLTFYTNITRSLRRFLIENQ